MKKLILRTMIEFFGNRGERGGRGGGVGGGLISTFLIM